MRALEEKLVAPRVGQPLGSYEDVRALVCSQLQANLDKDVIDWWWWLVWGGWWGEVKYSSTCPVQQGGGG